MRHHPFPHSLAVTAAVTILSALALGACERRGSADAEMRKAQQAAETSASAARQAADNAVSSVQGEARVASSQAAEAVDQAKDKAADLARDAKVAGQQLGTEVSSKVTDARITAAIHAELAKDAELSTLKIDVDTDAGRVALHGSAPSERARDRASLLAMAVRGVVSVDNQLRIDAAKS